MAKAKLRPLGRINLYFDGHGSQTNAQTPGSAHRGLWIAGHAKRPKNLKLASTDPLDAKGKIDKSGALPEHVIEALVGHLSRKGDHVLIAHDPSASGAAVVSKMGRQDMSIAVSP